MILPGAEFISRILPILVQISPFVKVININDDLFFYSTDRLEHIFAILKISDIQINVDNVYHMVYISHILKGLTNIVFEIDDSNNFIIKGRNKKLNNYVKVILEPLDVDYAPFLYPNIDSKYTYTISSNLLLNILGLLNVSSISEVEFCLRENKVIIKGIGYRINVFSEISLNDIKFHETKVIIPSSYIKVIKSILKIKDNVSLYIRKESPLIIMTEHNDEHKLSLLLLISTR